MSNKERKNRKKSEPSKDRKEYSAPKLTVYGKFSDLTQKNTTDRSRPHIADKVRTVKT